MIFLSQDTTVFPTVYVGLDIGSQFVKNKIGSRNYFSTIWCQQIKIIIIYDLKFNRTIIFIIFKFSVCLLT